MLPRLPDYLEPTTRGRDLVRRAPGVEPARNLLVRHDAPGLDVGQALRIGCRLGLVIAFIEKGGFGQEYGESCNTFKPSAPGQMTRRTGEQVAPHARAPCPISRISTRRSRCVYRMR